MSSSSSNSPTPEPPSKKRKRKDLETAEDSSDSDDSEAEPTGDQPVLSHAERRRQKRAVKQASQKESATKKRKLKDGPSVPAPANKRQNSVWVGNLSFKTTQENLRTFFESAGEITRIYLPTKTPSNPGMKPENRGFAYVDFATPEAKAAAISLSEQPLIGRKLLIKDGDDFTGRPAVAGAESSADGTTTSTTHSKTAQKILRAQKQPPAPTLFLGNLGFETTEQSIRQLFEAHRAVKKIAKERLPAENEVKKNEQNDVWIRKIRMGTFEDTGACKGFAFIDFTSIEHATAALVNPKNHQLNGRKLVVEYAGPDAVRRGAPKEKRQEGDAPPAKKQNDQLRKPKTERSESAQGRDQSWSSEKHKQEIHARADLGLDGEEGGRHRGIARTTLSRGNDKRDKGPRTRPKPGAALALAKRESAAIVPSKGQKITF